MNKYIVAALIIGLSVIVGFALFGGETTIKYGAAPGPDHYNQEYFLAGLVEGGEVTLLTGTTSTAPTAIQVCSSAVLDYGSSTAISASTTLPAIGGMINYCLPRVGDTWTVLFRNTASLATNTALIAVSSTTAEVLLEPDGQNVNISGGNSAWLRFIRVAATGSGMVVITVDELIDAD